MCDWLNFVGYYTLIKCNGYVYQKALKMFLMILLFFTGKLNFEFEFLSTLLFLLFKFDAQAYIIEERLSLQSS